MERKSSELIPYQWEAINSSGQLTKGVTMSRSINLAKVELRKQGMTIKKISKKRKPLFDFKSKAIKQGDITVFSRQMATMIQAGIPIIQSFDIVAKGQTNERMKELIENIKKDVESGSTLAESLNKYPVYFNALFCNLVDAGEKSGSLDIMLEKVASYKEKIETIKKKIKKAMTYPLAVIVIAFIVTAGLLTFVVPEFETLFKGFGADLPAFTRMVVSLSKAFQSYWYLIFGSAFFAVYSFIYALHHSTKFSEALDRLLLKMPIIGTIIKQAAIARFTRTLSITFAAGLPLVDALTAVAGATGNSLYAEATIRIREDISTGQQMHLAMDTTQLFPNMVIQMIAIGEESGTLEQMLSKVADFYEEAVDNSVDSLSSLLEPMIMSILGVLVGGLVVAMYLPIFKLGSVV
ncbi:MAG: type II secretion system F family protein [Legionellales bacterium]|nr:type II secretion system F family protein [Legionellales bacterium]